MCGETDLSVNRYLDCELLTSWMSSRQYAPEGGFAGRTNKLVDSCYSHWIGGCWPLLEVAMELPFSTNNSTPSIVDEMDTLQLHTSDASVLDSPVPELYSREGLIRYILCCCQAESGGLRDKPGK